MDHPWAFSLTAFRHFVLLQVPWDALPVYGTLAAREPRQQAPTHCAPQISSNREWRELMARVRDV